MWVYIVWVETWCIRYDKLANKMFRGYLTGKPYSRDTRKNQLSPFVMTFRILVMCWAHTSLRGKSTHELPSKIALVFN